MAERTNPLHYWEASDYDPDLNYDHLSGWMFAVSAHGDSRLYSMI